jgi:Flp pilus assembly protein TadG
MRTRQGASAVEFALTLPVLTTLFAAVMEYGWMFWQQQAILNAVRDGVRVGVATSQADDPETVAEGRAETSVEGFGLACDGTTDCVTTGTMTDVDGYDYLNLEMRYAYTPLTGGLLPVPDFIVARMVMCMEDQA